MYKRKYIIYNIQIHIPSTTSFKKSHPFRVLLVEGRYRWKFSGGFDLSGSQIHGLSPVGDLMMGFDDGMK